MRSTIGNWIFPFDSSLLTFFRSLDHSTIIYEGDSTFWKRNGDYTNASPPVSAPLLRLSACDSDVNLMATFHHNSSDVQMIDIRVPGTAYATLRGHKGDVNAVKWMPGSKSKLATCGDDCVVSLWDLDQPVNPSPAPMLSVSGTTPGMTGSASEYVTPVSSVNSMRETASPLNADNQYSPLLSWKLEHEVNNLSWSVKNDGLAVVYGK